MKASTLVTGGLGFIGSHLVDRLLSENKRVIVIDDCSTGSPENLAHHRGNPDLEIAIAKVSDCQRLAEILSRVESIYHLAAVVGVDLVMKSGIQTIQNNLHETDVILQAASQAHVPLLFASTSEVYGKSQKEAFSEEDDLLIGPPHLSRWSYACSKLMDEFLVLSYAQEKQLPVRIVRLFNTVGPRQTGKYGMVLPRFIQAARAGKPIRIFGDGTQTRCFCFVKDTVEALYRLQSTPGALSQVFNVGSTEEVTINELARTVIQLLDSKSTIEFLPYDQAYTAGFQDMLRRKPVVDKLERATGFKPSTSLKEIILKTAAAF
ncbi:MAG: NAD-dependent epimerase/dehydratase [Verrucomicrobiales bacterium]|nr:NAD-dependent epimerase/dehydratase [Verrucomicrobiales bacterium]